MFLETIYHFFLENSFHARTIPPGFVSPSCKLLVVVAAQGAAFSLATFQELFCKHLEKGISLDFLTFLTLPLEGK